MFDRTRLLFNSVCVLRVALEWLSCNYIVFLKTCQHLLPYQNSVEAAVQLYMI